MKSMRSVRRAHIPDLVAGDRVLRERQGEFALLRILSVVSIEECEFVSSAGEFIPRSVLHDSAGSAPTLSGNYLAGVLLCGQARSVEQALACSNEENGVSQGEVVLWDFDGPEQELFVVDGN